MDYEGALRYLYSFADWERGIGFGAEAPARFTLDRIRELLRVLGNPQQRFGSVHIAGSKGKGSTAAILESILRAAGMRTGLYTQPHLHTFRERMRIGNAPVAAETFTRLVERIARAVSLLEETQPHFGRPTTYELATAMGFLHFAEGQVDLAVVEVGLGGRLDATNVLAPRVSVITSIGLEHTAILGDTLAAIAGEKAGIIKDGGVLVHAPNPPEVLELFNKVCAERGARVLPADSWQGEPITRAAPMASAGETDGRSPWHCPAQMCRVSVLGEERTVRFPLRGAHQRGNLGVALTVVDELVSQGVPLPLEGVLAGIETARWPARFEQLSAWPPAIADGAHTPNAMACLRETFAEHYSGRSVVCILGTNADKEIGLLLEELLPVVSLVIAAKSRHLRAQDSEETAKAVKGRVPVLRAQSVAQAVSLGLDVMGSEDILCATGSLFVAAEAREAFGLAEHVDPPYIP